MWRRFEAHQQNQDGFTTRRLRTEASQTPDTGAAWSDHGNQREKCTRWSSVPGLSLNLPRRPLLSNSEPLHFTLYPMGRSATKSVARVYCDVNNRMGSSWYEYGTIATIVNRYFFTCPFRQSTGSVGISRPLWNCTESGARKIFRGS